MLHCQPWVSVVHWIFTDPLATLLLITQICCCHGVCALNLSNNLWTPYESWVRTEGARTYICAGYEFQQAIIFDKLATLLLQQKGKIHHPHWRVDQRMVTPGLYNQVQYLIRIDPPAQTSWIHDKWVCVPRAQCATYTYNSHNTHPVFKLYNFIFVALTLH